MIVYSYVYVLSPWAQIVNWPKWARVSWVQGLSQEVVEIFVYVYHVLHTPSHVKNFKNWLETVTVRKSLKNQSWKCHFCQHLGRSPVNVTGNWNVFEKNIKKSQLKRLKKWPWKLFFDKNIEKLRPNPDSLLMTVCKWQQILQDRKWFWNKVKIPKKEVERMGMKNLFFCQSLIFQQS